MSYTASLVVTLVTWSVFVVVCVWNEGSPPFGVEMSKDVRRVLLIGLPIIWILLVRR